MSISMDEIRAELENVLEELQDTIDILKSVDTTYVTLLPFLVAKTNVLVQLAQMPEKKFEDTDSSVYCAGYQGLALADKSTHVHPECPFGHILHAAHRFHPMGD